MRFISISMLNKTSLRRVFKRPIHFRTLGPHVRMSEVANLLTSLRTAIDDGDKIGYRCEISSLTEEHLLIR